MSQIFFSSDPHYGHENIIKYCNRPFVSAASMTEALITNHNTVVGHDDVTYFLGDMFFCDAKRAAQIMNRLNGRKRLILGNHDKLIRNQVPLQNMFEKIYPDLHAETIDGVHVVMCHYPLLTWHRAARGAFMLHGHSHNNIAFDPNFRRLDVGVDAQGYTPIRWQDIKKKLDACVMGDIRNY